MTTIKTYYEKIVKEVTDMVKYIYPKRPDTEIQSNKRHIAPIIHKNVSFYSQALMQFHETNPTPTNFSNKKLKI